MDLSYCALEDECVRGAWWERLGILCIFLPKEDKGDAPLMARKTTWGIFSGSVSSGMYTLF